MLRPSPARNRHTTHDPEPGILAMSQHAARPTHPARRSARATRRQRPARPWALEGLEERRLLTLDFSQVKAQLPGLLDHMQSAVTQQILADSLPMVGGALQNPVNNNPAKLLDTIGNQLGPSLPANSNATAGDVQNALYNTLNGMNLFPQGSQEGQDVQVVQQGPNDYEFKVHLATQSPIVVSKPFDLGLPKVGLSASGTVTASLSYAIELDFGVDLQGSTTHLYLNTSPSPELTLGVDVALSNASASGSLGTLGVKLYDGALPVNGPWKTTNAAPSEFKGTFTFDVTGPDPSHRLDASQATPAYFANNTTVALKGKADVDLGAVLTVDNFPTVALNLQVDWPFTSGGLQGDRPTVAFNDVQLDVGSFLNFLRPYFKQLHTTMTPVDTVVEALTKPLPVLSQLPGESGLSLWGIAQGIDPNLTALQPFVTAFQRLYALSSQQGLPNIPSGKVIIDYGSFDLGNADPRDPNFQLAAVTPNITSNEPSPRDQLKNNPDPNAQAAYTYIYDPQTGLEGKQLGSLQLNFLDDPATVFRAMLLQDVTLIQYTLPTLDSWSGNKKLFSFDQTFPLGPVSFEIKGDIHAKAGLTFGYDTYGLVNLGKPNPIPNEPAISPLDGLYVKDASASLQGELDAKLILNVPVFQPYVGGGVTATVDLHLQPDPNDPSNPVRFSQLDAEIAQNPLDIFQMPAGKLDGHLDVGIRIGVDFGFPIGFVGVDYSTHIADATLLDFTTQSKQSQLVLAHYDPNDPTTLILNLGAFEAARQYQTSDTQESFEVGHHRGNSPKGDETVDVTAYDQTQTFSHVSKVVAQGSNNDETILFDSDLLADANVTTGDGNNTLTYLGQGDATFNAGKGNNALTGGSGTNDFRVVGDGANTLIGGPGTNDLAVVGNGDNTLTAGGGDDKLSVQGDGANSLTAGPGRDTVTIAAGPNTTTWNTISWQVGDGNLVIYARGGHNALEVSGSAKADTFTVGPYPTPIAPGVVVTAGSPSMSATITAPYGYVQTVAIDGGRGADTTTVNDLGPNSMVEEVGVNLGEALAPDGSEDVTTVNGNPDTHAVAVGTESAWLHYVQQGPNVVPQDGGVMMVRTRPGYKVNVAVANHEDDLDVDVKGSKNAVTVQSNTGHTVINTDAGSDSFVIGGDAAPNNGRLYYVPPKPASPSLLFGLRGLLEIHAGPGANALSLVEDQEAAPTRLTMTDSTLEGYVGTPSQPIDVHYSVSPNGTFGGGISLETGKGADALSLQSTPANAPTSLVTGGGGDQVDVGDSGQTLDSIRSPVSLDGTDGTPTVTVHDEGVSGGKDYLFTAFMGNDFLIRSNPVPPPDAVAFRYKNLGTMTLDAGNHGNTITVRSAGAAVVLNAGNGNNAILVGDQANGNHLGITRPLTVNGQGGTNQLTLNDQGTATPNQTYTLGPATAQRTGAGLISYNHIQGVVLNAGSGNGNTINLLGTASGVQYQANAGVGNAATINLASAGKTLDTFQGALAIDGQGGSKSVNLDDTGTQTPRDYTLSVGLIGRDKAPVASVKNIGALSLSAGSGGNTIEVLSTPMGVTTQVNAGPGADTIDVGSGGPNSTIDAIQGPLTVAGQAGHGTALVIEDEGHPPDPARSYQVTSTQVERKGPPVAVAPISYSGLGTLTLEGSGQGYDIPSTAAGTSTRIEAAAGNDMLRVGNGTLTGIQGPLMIDGQGGTNQLVLDDQMNPAGRTFTLGPGIVAGTLMAPVAYSHTQQVTVDGGPGFDTFRVLGSAPGASIALKGGAGMNLLVGPNGANTWEIAGPNSGTLKGSLLKSPVAFSGMQNLRGGSGGDTFRLLTGGSVGGTIDGAGGANTLDYSGDVADVAVDLLLKEATGVGQVLNVAEVTGSVGNDILVGGGSPAILRGGTGRNLIIAGSDAGRLVGGGGDDILIAGTTAYDANLAALEQIMKEWTLKTPFNVRVGHIMNGGGLNGPFLLHAGQNATVTSNSKANDLTDGGGTDWLFLSALDAHHNGKSSDVITQL
jgi:hypothetical protein